MQGMGLLLDEAEWLTVALIKSADVIRRFHESGERGGTGRSILGDHLEKMMENFLIEFFRTFRAVGRQMLEVDMERLAECGIHLSMMPCFRGVSIFPIPHLEPSLQQIFPGEFFFLCAHGDVEVQLWGEGGPRRVKLGYAVRARGEAIRLLRCNCSTRCEGGNGRGRVARSFS